MDKTIDLYKAIEEMRELTKKRKFFSFVHATYNRDSMTSEGDREVKKALLRKPASDEQVDNADLKLFYMDEEINEPRICWQPLIKSFNGIPVKLS